MKSLLHEVEKMSQVYGANIRDSALVASLQRVIHYKLAGYGSVAAYAKTLARPEEAARLAEYGDREEALDRELTELAKKIINPQARLQPEARPAYATTH
jgi:ferritin-like metal-binding protein YciE